MNNSKNSKERKLSFQFPSLADVDEIPCPETSAKLQELLQGVGMDNLIGTDGRSITDSDMLDELSRVGITPDEVASETDDEEGSCLTQAVVEGNLERVRELVESGYDVNHMSADGETAMACAVTAGYLEIVKYLLSQKAEPDRRGEKVECTALMEAASAGFGSIVEQLLLHYARVDIKSNSNNTALHYAASGGHVECVRLLVETDNRNRVALAGNLDDYPSIIEMQNENGHTALMEAGSNGFIEVARVLLEYGANINTHSNEFKESALTLASYKGHSEMVKFLLSQGADHEHRTDEMHTALMEAAMDGHVEVARILLQHGAQVNMPPDSFESPLTLAACGGHTQLACLLIGYDADVEEVNDEGYTPLMEAAREGHEEIVALLLACGAHVDVQTEETQETALTLAACSGFCEVVELLLRCGADLELGCSTPLMEAAQEGHIDLVRVLIKRGANVNTETATGDTALHYACENGHVEVCRVLLEHGAKLEHPSEGGRTPLMKASRAGNLDCVQLFVDSNAVVDQRTTQIEHTALSLACNGGQYQVVEYLLKCGANPNAQLKDGSTMVIEAAKAGHTKVIELLLDYPAKPANNILGRIAGQEYSGLLAKSQLPINPETNIDSILNNTIAIGDHNCQQESLENKLNQLQPASKPSRRNRPSNILTTTNQSQQNGTISPPSLPDSPPTPIKSTSSSSPTNLLNNNNNVPPNPPKLDNLSDAISETAPSPVNNKTQWPASRSCGGCGSAACQQQGLDSSTKIATINGGPTRHRRNHSAVTTASAPAGAVNNSVQKSNAACGTTDSLTEEEISSICRPSSVGLAGIDVNACIESSLESALSLACSGGHIELVKLLIDRGANIRHRDKKTCTPLHIATQNGQLDVLKLLLDRGGDIEAQMERNKETSLSIACANGKLEIVEELLLRGANKEHRNVSDYTPLSLAASGNYVEVIKLLLKHDAEINSRTGSKLGISPLMLAAMNGHKAAVSLLLEMGSDINAQIETNKNTALTLACFQGRHEVVSLLVEKKANIEHRAKTGLTPLMEAASGGFLEVAKVLLDEGADVNATPVPSSRDTALTIAADKGYLKLVKLLLDKLAHVDAKNKKGATPLWLACSGGYLEVVQTLREAQADVNSCDNRKVSCLMAAVKKGHVKVVKYLVKYVSQFPADSECQRCTEVMKQDKELSKRSCQCVTIIKQAKEKQEQEATKNANILLEQLNQEREDEARKQVAQAKKRERKRQKRKAKQTKEPTGKEDDIKNDNYNSPPSERVSSEERREMWRLSAEYDTRGNSEPRLPSLSQYSHEAPISTAPSHPDQNSDSHSLKQNNPKADMTSTTVTSRANKKKRSRTKEVSPVSITPTPETTTVSSSRVSSHPTPVAKTVVTPIAESVVEKTVMDEKREKHRGKKQAIRSSKRTSGDNKSLITEDPPILSDTAAVTVKSTTLSSTVPSLISQSEDPWADYEDDVLNEIDYNTWCEITGSTNTGDIGQHGFNDQWKTVPKRKTAIPVSKRDIGKVIGQNGATVKALRLHTGAHIDIEDIKEGSDITERSIHIRGQPESVSRAKELIQDLISGKLSGKEIATIASPRRTTALTAQPVQPVQLPKAIVQTPHVPVSTPKVSHKNQNTTSNKPLPIRKVPRAPSQLQMSTTTNNNNIMNSSIGGQVPWVNTGPKEEMNFASVAAAGVVSQTSSKISAPPSPPPASNFTPVASHRPSDTSYSNNSVTESIRQAERFMASVTTGGVPMQTPMGSSCGFSDMATNDFRGYAQGMSSIPDVSRDSSGYMDGYPGSSSSPVTSLGLNQSTTPFNYSKHFLRAPGSERHQRWTNTSDLSSQFPHELLPSNPSPLADWGSLSGGSTSSSVHESGLGSRFSSTLDSSASTVHHSNPPFIGTSESSQQESMKSTVLDTDSLSLDSQINAYNSSSHDMKYQQFPRAVPNLNPQAQSFSPSPSTNIMSYERYPSSRSVNSQYVTPPELKGLPRASELNPSASTFQPQTVLSPADANSSQQRLPPNTTPNSSQPNMLAQQYSSPGASRSYSSNIYSNYSYQGGLGESSGNNSFNHDQASLSEDINATPEQLSSYLQSSTASQRPIGAERRRGVGSASHVNFPINTTTSEEDSVSSNTFISSNTPCSSQQPQQLWAALWAAPQSTSLIQSAPQPAATATETSSTTSFWSSTSWSQNGPTEWD